MSYRLISVSLLSAAALLLGTVCVHAADAPAPVVKASAAQAPAAKASAAKTVTPQADAPKAAASHPARKARPAKPPKTPRIPADQLVDINTAKADELKKLPGISDAEAAKIIAGRPYGSKSWLHTKNVLPAEKYETIRDLIAVKDAALHMGMPKKK